MQSSSTVSATASARTQSSDESGNLSGLLWKPVASITLHPGHRVWRIHARQPFGIAWNTFRHHGPTDSRFDHPLTGSGVEPKRAILYAAVTTGAHV